MHERSILGAADVPDSTLASMVASVFHAERAELTSSRAVPFPYDIPSITTAGRYVVDGSASVDGEPRDFRFFVKHVWEFARSPQFATVPDGLRAWAAKTVPWRTEAEAYEGDLGALLPSGLRMARASAIHRIDEGSYALWLEWVPSDDSVWDLDRYERAAELLGRFAGSPKVRAAASGISHEFRIEYYTDGRLKHLVLPLLHSEVWHHPLVREPFADLRARILDAAERVDAITAELVAMPTAAAHGDACPNNLLVRPDGDGFTMIDFGFFRTMPVGFDLGQLLVGDVQIGRRTADDLAQREEVTVPAYCRGLSEAGLDVDIARVRRAHALALMLFSGLSALPFELLEAQPTPQLEAQARARAAIARFSLDLLETTAGSE